MFTGIVAETGEIDDVTATEDGRRLRIDADETTDGLRHGDSVSVSGACLTVERTGGDWFEVFLAEETIAKTYLGDLDVGDVVNLERALPADGRFDGHFVQGHVDVTTELLDVWSVGEDWEYEWAIPDGFGKYVVSKGSVALDGVSLTVAEREASSFTTAIIPTTRELTTFSEKEPGDPVHLEVDVLAKYVEQLVADREV